MAKDKFGLPYFIWNALGFVVFFAGSITFYNGFSELVLIHFESNYYAQLGTGLVLLFISWKIFGKEYKFK